MMREPSRDELYEEALRLGVEGRCAVTDWELTGSVQSDVPEPAPRHPTGDWFRDHLLSLILLALFLLSLLAQWYFQYRYELDQALQQGQPAPQLWSAEFLNAFLASVFENWQSEFLQLLSFVVLATYFIHRGSPQSRDGDDEMSADIKAIRHKLGA